MKTDIYYYSGTGNSLWTARRLAEELGDAELHPISKIKGSSKNSLIWCRFLLHFPSLSLYWYKTYNILIMKEMSDDKGTV